MKNSNFQLRQSAKKPRSKKLLALAAILLIVLLVGAFFTYRHFTKPVVDLNATDPTNTSAKTEATEKSTSKNTDSTPSNITAQEVPTSQNLAVTISNNSQVNGIVTSKADITGASGNGSCVFTFSTTDSRPVVEQTTSSNGSCEVAISEVRFDKIGDWNLDVTFFQNNTKASATKQVTIN